MKYKSVELFAGAGGLALGFEQAGFENVLAVDNDKNSVETLKHNRPKWFVIESDVEGVNYSKTEADVIIGGPPCQSFSHSGKRLGLDDARGTAFYGFAKAVAEIQPKIFVFENVKGLKTHDHGNTLQTIIGVLGNLGYRMKHQVLNSLGYDVPQKRERTIIVGVREDITNNYQFPIPSKRILTLYDALNNVPYSKGSTYSETRKRVMELVPEGGNWRDLPIDIAKEYMKTTYYASGGRTGIAKRLSWNKPAPTIMCSPIQKQTERCHPTETRPLTIREAARIQTFPDDWEFIGSIANQYKQIGNAVPVNMAKAIGESVFKFLEDN